jgi:hypothetical protein
MVTKINIEITMDVVTTITMPISNFIQEDLFLTTTTIIRIHLSLAMNMMRTIVQALTFTETQQVFFTIIHFCTCLVQGDLNIF